MVVMRTLHLPGCIFCVVIISIGIFSNLSIAQESEQQIQALTHKKTRIFDPNDPLLFAYHEGLRSIEAAEKFIRTYPEEKDLCAGVLLRIARLYNGRNEKSKAIDMYQKAIDEYPEELVPDVNSEITVKDAALLATGLIEKEMGNRDKALEIFKNLSQSSNSNVKNASRIHYLSTLQSHLILKAKVSTKKKRYAEGEEISGSVTIKNSEKEDVTFQCFVRIRRKKHLSFGAIFPRTMPEEVTLKPGQEYKETFVFTSRERLEAEQWVIDCDLNGVTVESNTVNIKILETK